MKGFVIACKACHENLYEKVSETLVRDNIGMGFDCLWDLLNLFIRCQAGETLE